MRRLFVLGCVAVVLAGAASPARAAEFGFSVGQDLGVVDIAGARNVSNLGTRIGFRAGGFFPFVSGDYGRYSLERDYESQDFSTIASNGYVLTLGAGLRYLFDEPKADRVVPYMVGSGYTLIPFHSSTESDDIEIQDATSLGFLAGGGADYFVGDQFSIGGEVGFSALFFSFRDSEKTVRFSVMQIYSGIELTFLF